MAGIGQGVRSSRTLSTVHPGWRAKLRRLDRRCAAAEKLISFQRYCGFDSRVAERVYQKSDMERMLIRLKIKEYHA